MADSSGPECVQKLEDAFGSRVAFGTAGLRAEMGPGPARMNELTVLQASQGLLRHLEDELAPTAAGLCCVGCAGLKYQ